jgi:uncharacterized damage-inducible protein DinB
MTSAEPAQATHASTTPHARDQFLQTFERESATTVRVLRAYPADQLDLKPSEKSKSARELAFLFVLEQGLAHKALTTGFDWSTPPAERPAPPETMDEIIAAFEQAYRGVADLVRGMDDAAMHRTANFFVAPKTLGDIPMMDFLWFLLHDQIHHRGQFSVYLRMAGARVPSIYGPTADEPWF